MKQIALALTMIALFCACQKEPNTGPNQNPPCANADGKCDVRIYNGFQVQLLVRIFQTGVPSGTGFWSQRTLYTGDVWQFQAPVGSYHVEATGHDPGPFAGNAYNFNDDKTAEDCEPLEINY